MSSPTPQEQAWESALRNAQLADGFYSSGAHEEVEGEEDTDAYPPEEGADFQNNPPVARSSSPMEQRIAREIQQKHAEQLKREASRAFAKGAGNASNATGSVGWDGFISFATTYAHIMARGVVSILSPEPVDPNTSSPSQQMLHTFIPPYRPLKEPGDFLYFLALLAMSSIVVLVALGLILLLFSVFIFPVFMPGLATS